MKSGGGKNFDGLAAAEKAIQAECDKQKKSGSPEMKKICYYLEPIKRQISVPLNSFKPADRICKTLKKTSPEICQVRKPVKIEKGVTDYNKLRIKELKRIIADRGTTCQNCLDKSDYVKRCMETENLHTEL